MLLKPKLGRRHSTKKNKSNQNDTNYKEIGTTRQQGNSRTLVGHSSQDGRDGSSSGLKRKAAPQDKVWNKGGHIHMNKYPHHFHSDGRRGLMW